MGHVRGLKNLLGRRARYRSPSPPLCVMKRNLPSVQIGAKQSTRRYTTLAAKRAFDSWSPYYPDLEPMIWSKSKEKWICAESEERQETQAISSWVTTNISVTSIRATDGSYDVVSYSIPELSETSTGDAIIPQFVNSYTVWSSPTTRVSLRMQYARSQNLTTASW